MVLIVLHSPNTGSGEDLSCLFAFLAATYSLTLDPERLFYGGLQVSFIFAVLNSRSFGYNNAAVTKTTGKLGKFGRPKLLTLFSFQNKFDCCTCCTF